jgi:Cu(I)/Ag(I) efflux system protein CusF
MKSPVSIPPACGSLLLVAGMLLSWPVQALAQGQDKAPPGHAGHGGHASHAGTAAQVTPQVSKAAAAESAVAMTDAEVRRIDREAGKVSLRHGPIPNLDMPPMTMVFVVRDKAWLDGLKVGDKVRFRAVEEQGNYVVTTLQPAR